MFTVLCYLLKGFYSSFSYCYSKGLTDKTTDKIEPNENAFLTLETNTK